MISWTSKRVPCTTLVREALWLIPTSAGAATQRFLEDRRGRLALQAYAVYSDASDDSEFDANVRPVLEGLSTSRSRLILALVESSDTFDAPAVRRRIEVARSLGALSLVELRGPWTGVALKVLMAARPNFIRLGPSLVHGLAAVPEQFRVVISLAEFAREYEIPLVATGVVAPSDLDALRMAGVDLIQFEVAPPHLTIVHSPERHTTVSLRGRLGKR